MIRSILITFFLIGGVSIHGQTKKEIKTFLKEINSKKNVENYKLDYPKWNIEFVQLNNTDSNFPKKLIKLKKGQTKRIRLNDGQYHYKLLEKIKKLEFRASYIYLNGSELNRKKIDSLRPLIVEKYKSGTPFEKLVKKYNMDGNSKKGDLGWFKTNRMVPEFESAVRKNKKGDIFLVNVDAKKWYYVVLKTHDNRENNSYKFIKIKEL